MVELVRNAPTCDVKGGNTSWINASSNPSYRTITATCSDSESGCVTSSFSKKYESNINTSTAGAIDVNNGGTVKDNAGNITNCAANQTVKIDKNKPDCTTSGGNSGKWSKTSVTIYGTCSDTGGSNCSQNVISKNITSNNSGGVSPGTVYDNAGNSRTCGNVVANVDTQAPNVSISSKKEGYELTVSVSDNLSGINGNAGGWNGPVSGAKITTSSATVTSNGNRVTAT